VFALLAAGGLFVVFTDKITLGEYYVRLGPRTVVIEENEEFKAWIKYHGWFSDRMTGYVMFKQVSPVRMAGSLFLTFQGVWNAGSFTTVSMTAVERDGEIKIERMDMLDGDGNILFTEFDPKLNEWSRPITNRFKQLKGQ
jgi:hypothetical protein